MTSVSDSLAEVAAAAINAQPWYRRNANTVVAALGAAVVFLTWLATSSLGLPDWALAVAGGLAAVVQVISVRLTRNGLTDDTTDALLERLAPVAELRVHEAVRAVKRSTAGELARRRDDGRRAAEDARREQVGSWTIPDLPVLRSGADELLDALYPGERR